MLKNVNIRSAVWDVNQEIVEARRHIHQFPEISWQEKETQAFILRYLEELDLEDFHPIARTGVSALVRGNTSGPCVLWRADIDALPVSEKTNLPYASKNEGVMHACGHDVHTAIGLGLARLLSDNRDNLKGNVRLLFQPAEESTSGAQLCIEEGVLDTPNVDRVLGLHISADVPVGMINVAPGPFFAAPTSFRIEIQGLGGHAASPHQAVDAVVIASQIVTALQTVVSRNVSPLENAVLTIGKIEAGVRGNVIAESAVMTGTIRTYSTKVRDLIIRRAESLIKGICDGFDASYVFTHRSDTPALVNDSEVTEFVKDEARQFLGNEPFSMPTMGAEDMSYLLQERPGCFFWLGARNEKKGIAGRHHDSRFIIDEDSIALGLEFSLRLIERSLEKI